MSAQYFEDGCLCFLSGKIEPAKSSDDAFQYYLDNCTCSRHPESFKKPCWDRTNPAARKEALLLISKRHPHLAIPPK